MKINHKSNLAITIIMYVVIALQVSVIFLTLCRFFRWFNFYSTNKTIALEIIELVFCTLVIVLAVFYLTCKYHIKDGKILAIYGFIDLFRGQLIIANIISADFMPEKNRVELTMKDIDNDVETIKVDILIDKANFPVLLQAISAENESIESNLA